MDFRFKILIIYRDIQNDDNGNAFKKNHSWDWSHEIEQKSGKGILFVFIAAPFYNFPGGYSIQHIQNSKQQKQAE